MGTLRAHLHFSFASEWSSGAHLPGVPTYLGPQCSMVLGGERDWFALG